MLALERSRHEQPYLQQLSMDPSMHDPFGSLNIDGYSYSHFPPGSNAFFDSSSAFMVEAPHQLYNPKFDSYPHPPSGPPSIATAPSDQTASSSASGPSIPSTSSSAIGSPYQENWMDMNAGYPQDYVSAGMDADIMFAHDKLPDSFVGKCENISSFTSQAIKSPAVLSSQPVNPVSASSATKKPPVAGPSGASHFTWQHTDVAAMASKQVQAMSPPSSTLPLAAGSRKNSASMSRRRSAASPNGESPTMYSPEMGSRKRALPRDSTTGALKARKMSTPEATMKRNSLQSPKSPKASRSSSHSGSYQNSFFKQSSGIFVPPLESSYPSLIQPMQQQSSYPPPTVSYAEEAQYAFAQSSTFNSPAASPLPHAQSLHHPHHPHSAIPSPYLAQSGFPSRPMSYGGRRSSVSSVNSRRSPHSPLTGSVDYEEEGKEKGRCPHPDCGRVFKDLKAHMLTHQSERPEKCPIVTCEYHLKGFARKYDKNRHTLTHYKGTMVCGFCPGSGSAAEKSFNRADVFKRHLTSVHGVEQTAPNSRKKSPPTSNRKISNYCHDATGKCSTCSTTFNNAQEFYEHLDDCVLRVVQQEEPSEAINLQRLTEVASDDAVRQTMEKHMLVDNANDLMTNHADDDDDIDDSNDSPSNTNNTSGKGSIKSGALNKPSSSLSAGVSKPRPAASRRRNNRNNYPPSWGCPTNKMKMKKRVLCLYDGQRRLWKDEMMLDNEFEVRLKLLGANNGASPGRDAYVTDLDVETMKRAEGVHNATEEERGPWMPDTTTGGSYQGLIGQAAVPIIGNPQDDVNIEELMS
ncbi:hypothetical protein FQN52_000660 [Onygenales sp. PD_12]|nr:hypothetical protein FQN53_001582 [Emmonsiellopsis sp. PD_33]KAK2793708.1 hypothetical protein FQN52_000660 [Onygenales sp. PD_12]